MHDVHRQAGRFLASGQGPGLHDLHTGRIDFDQLGRVFDVDEDMTLIVADTQLRIAGKHDGRDLPAAGGIDHRGMVALRVENGHAARKRIEQERIGRVAADLDIAYALCETWRFVGGSSCFSNIAVTRNRCSGAALAERTLAQQVE